MRLRNGGGGEGEGRGQAAKRSATAGEGSRQGGGAGEGRENKGRGRWRRGREKIMETMDEREGGGREAHTPFSFSVRYNSQSLSLPSSLPS